MTATPRTGANALRGLLALCLALTAVQAPAQLGDIAYTKARAAERKAAAASAAVAAVIGLPASNGTDDTTVINAALGAISAGGVVRGQPGQNYLTSATLVLRSNTTLDMTGARVTLKPGSNTNILSNRAYLSVARTVSDAAMGAASTTLTSAAGGFTSADLGRTIVVAGADYPTPSDGTEASVNGVLVTTVAAVVSATQLTLAAPAINAVSGATAKLYDRDTNIIVRGGIFDRGTNGGGPLAKQALLFRRVDGLTLTPERVLGTANGKFAIGLADVTKVRASGIDFQTESDAFHIMGPARDIAVTNLSGQTSDDFIAIGTSDYSSYADVQGDVSDVVVSGLFPRGGNAPRVALLFSSSGHTLRRITVEKVRGEAQSAIQLTNNSEDILLGDIKLASFGSNFIAINNDNVIGAVTHKNVTVRDVAVEFTGAGKNAIVAVSSFAPGQVTVENLDVADLSVRGGATAFTPVRVNDSTVQRLTLRNARIRMGAGGNVVSLNGISASVDSLALNGVDTNAGNIVAANASATVTGDTTTGSNSITNVAGAVYAGQPISGSGIPFGSYVGTVSGSTITVLGPAGSAANATATATGVTLTLAQRLPRLSLGNIVAIGAGRLFDLGTTTSINYTGIEAGSWANGLGLARATANLTIRGAGYAQAIGTGTSAVAITAGGIVTNISADFPPTAQAGGVPTVVVSAAAGTGATATLSANSTDRGGVLTITPGTGATTGIQATMTFTKAVLAGTVRNVQLTPLNAAAAAAGAYINNVNSTNFQPLVTTALTGAASWAYEVNRGGS